VRDPPTDTELLRTHILETTQYRGFADPTVRLDHESRTMGMQSYAALADYSKRIAPAAHSSDVARTGRRFSSCCRSSDCWLRPSIGNRSRRRAAKRS